MEVHSEELEWEGQSRKTATESSEGGGHGNNVWTGKMAGDGSLQGKEKLKVNQRLVNLMIDAH